MVKEWLVLLKTIGENVFTLGVWAPTESEAKSKAKHISQGCAIIGEPKEVVRRYK